MKKNEEYIVDIIDNGFQGEGIAKIDGITVFIPNVIKGEKVKNIPVKVFKEDLSIYVNKKILGELGITLPDSIKNDKAYIEM